MNSTDNFILTRNFLFVYFVLCSVVLCCVMLRCLCYFLVLFYSPMAGPSRQSPYAAILCRSVDTNNAKDTILIMHIHLYISLYTTLHNTLLYQTYIREDSNDIWCLPLTLPTVLYLRICYLKGGSIGSSTLDNSTLHSSKWRYITMKQILSVMYSKFWTNSCTFSFRSKLSKNTMILITMCY